MNLQGDVEKHASVFKKLNAEIILVKNPDDLSKCDGLVFPGGESSTMKMMIEFSNLTNALTDFVQKKPIFATCAGVVLLAKTILNDIPTKFAKLDISVKRNGWGRQVHSFISEIDFLGKSLEAVFIRAPKISEIGKLVTVLAKIENEPVLIEQDNILASTFHPELSEHSVIQKYWLEKYFG